jgi:ketosteroid isomerase-like protein
VTRAPEEAVRDGYAAFNSGERDATVEWWHGDGEYVVSREDPDSATHRGLDAISAQNRRWVDSYPDLRVEPLDIRPNGDRVFVWVRFSGHGAGSDVPIEMELAHVCTIEDGRFKRIEEYMDRDEGLAAAGLG